MAADCSRRLNMMYAMSNRGHIDCKRIPHRTNLPSAIAFTGRRVAGGSIQLKAL